MAWLGMNLETVKGEIPKWQQLAEDINTIITTVNTQVQQADEAWNGKDSDDFISEWEGQHRPALEKIKGLIENLQGQLQGDVQQQAEASGS
ncbi:WXG100 family type VII secretion target [Janibacter sp. CX7]|uniref:WXG100 family type VII secretion target n=1 Tax=unclassified Janibacter TaxID=2649294 RepID=UPI0020CC5AF6|nr:WXG100 family type VII secretion target [Janibacter sp. CX7]UTT66110.1 WXG100 family type VII secretion target [Janibacter sp. CX7]